MIDLLPEALADALGSVVADVRRECRREIEIVSAESRAIIAELRAQNTELKAIIDARIDGAIAGVADGSTNTIEAIVRAEVAKLPPALPGAAGRDGVDGKDGQPGQPGKDGKDGADGAPGLDGVSVASISREGPRLTIELDDGRVFDAGEIVGAKGDRGEAGKDGVGVAGALIDREGALVVTQSDGSVLALGPVVGRDGVDGKDGAPGRDGKDGAPGLGLEDLSVSHDGGRGFVFRMARGDLIKEFPVTVPVMIYRGVFREDQGGYACGDVVTHGGSLWHCDRDTEEKPGDGSKDWTLAAKRGRDGRDGKNGDRGEQGPEGRAGKDLTQLGPDGTKW